MPGIAAYPRPKSRTRKPLHGMVMFGWPPSSERGLLHYADAPQLLDLLRAETVVLQYLVRVFGPHWRRIFQLVGVALDLNGAAKRVERPVHRMLHRIEHPPFLEVL